MADEDTLVVSLTRLIARVAERHTTLVKQRAEALSSNGQTFNSTTEVEIFQLQAIQSTLEAALACARNWVDTAEEYIDAAESQISAWAELMDELDDDDDDDDDD
ncbi:MAG: hypothetical protein HC914_09625 [Chloroflexaceae bacterium]|nr:hypothetical protein [Chloroflexaceae bacterium]